MLLRCRRRGGKDRGGQEEEEEGEEEGEKSGFHGENRPEQRATSPSFENRHDGGGRARFQGVLRMTAHAVGLPEQRQMVSHLDLDVLACQFKPSRNPRDGWHGSGKLMTDDQFWLTVNKVEGAPAGYPPDSLVHTVDLPLRPSSQSERASVP